MTTGGAEDPGCAQIVMARETIPRFQGPLLLKYFPNSTKARYIIGYEGKPDWNSDETRRAECVTQKVTGGPVTWAHGPTIYFKYTLDDFIEETGLNTLKDELAKWKKERRELLIDSAVLVIAPV